MAVVEMSLGILPDEGTNQQTLVDATVLGNAILDNEHWNQHGIEEDALAIMLEMHPVCEWGATYTKTRLNQALQLLAESPVVTKRGDRWYAYFNPTLVVMDAEGERYCARPNCPKSISHLKANAQYCSANCRQRDSRRRQRSE
jgi:hypothetical protein